MEQYRFIVGYLRRNSPIFQSLKGIIMNTKTNAVDVDRKFLTKVTPYDANGEEGIVRFVLGNGQEVVVRIADLPENTRERAMYHGISQKVGDATSSLSKDRRFGDAFAIMNLVKDTLVEGNWNVGREGGSSDLVAALAMLKGLPEEDVRIAVKRMDEDTLRAVMANAAVKAKIAKIKSDRLAKAAKASTDEELPDIGI